MLTSDHGESLGEHGERTHSLLTYDATLHVPLIIAHPALPHGVRVRGQVRTVDALPTVLDLLGVPVPAGLDGESLVPLMNGDQIADRESYVETLVPHFNNAWAELRGVRTTTYKYIRAPRSELYELATDPGETKNVLAERLDVAVRFSKRLDEYLDEDVMRTGEGGAAKLDLVVADRERLAALGYQVADHGALVVYNNLAMGYIERERYDDAIALLEKGTDDPRKPLHRPGVRRSVLLRRRERRLAGDGAGDRLEHDHVARLRRGLLSDGRQRRRNPGAP